ncbi:MAG: TetR/AcrR family transcriptional regulator [Ruminococcus sp.]
MSRMYNKEESKRRILSVCVHLFIEKGFTNTTNAEILKLAEVSNGTFYNIFKSKDGVLMELTEFMFSNQFSIAERFTGGNPDPILLYAVETSIQMTITELNENLREIYVEAYTNPRISDCIYHKTAAELHKIFGEYLPEYTEADFFELGIGSAGIMRSYMARKCDCYFTLNKKLQRFLSMSLSAYNVPKDKQQAVISKVLQMDIMSVSNLVIQNLFAALEMKYEFSLSSSEQKTF